MTAEDQSFELCQKKLAIIDEITNAIIASDDISTISYLILDLAINHTNAEKGSLMLLGERQELSILSARGIEHQLARSYRVKLGEGIAGKVAENRIPVLVRDIDSDERFKNTSRDRYKTRSFISCPIIGKDKLFGVLNLNDKKDGKPFTDLEFSLLKIVAGQAGLALKNAFLVKQYREKTVELEEVNRKLISMDLAKTDFLTRVSHELRTPLNSIKGAVYYLNKTGKDIPGDVREFHEIIDGETDKLINIIEKQLDFLRLEDETRIIKKTVFSLGEILKETSRAILLRNLLSRKKLELDIRFNGDIPDIVGDKILVSQLFLNLIEGVAHHLEKPGKLTLKAVENDQVEVLLCAGEKLSKQVLDSLFTSRNLFGSERSEAGLKLYLASKAAEVHGWTISAENHEDGFRVTLLISRGSRQKVEAALSMTMDRVIEFTSELMGVNICSLMLSDELTGDLVINSARGLDEDVIKRTRIKVGDRIAGWVAYEGKPLLIEDIEADPRFSQKNLDKQYSSRSLISLPLKVDGKVIGVLNLNNKKSEAPFTKKDLTLATMMGERISKLIEKIQKEAGREGDIRKIASSLENLLYAESRYPKKDSNHSELLDSVLTALGATREEKELALYVGMVYDLGLMLLDKSLLGKKNKLSTGEASSLKTHPHTTLDLLGEIEFSEEVREIILHHHEHFDGTGYPDGLKGEEIPLVARVLAVVDGYCAITEDRPYRRAKNNADALKEIQEGAGTLYDPRVVNAFRMVTEAVLTKEKA